MKQQPKIGFLTSADAKDQKIWSGIHYHLLRGLEENFGDVVVLGPIKKPLYLRCIIAFLDRVCTIFLGKKFNKIHNTISSKFFKSRYETLLREVDLDIIFASSASVEIAYLETDIPICQYTDAFFGQLHNYYENHTNLISNSVKEAYTIEECAARKTTSIICTSDWAKNYAIDSLKFKKEQVHFVPFGANIDEVPDISPVNKKSGLHEKCNLLFLGKAWERKGGPIAFEALETLSEMGLSVSLTVCGCIPSPEFQHPDLNVIPFLNKNNEKEYQAFLELLHRTHFLLLPSRAECFGIVFCEASAFGIPSITTHTGGIPSAVEDGVNGYKLPYDANGEAYAKVIYEIFTDKEKYQKLVISSREKFDKNLNWRYANEKIKECIATTLSIAGNHVIP
ncbi:MAG: glycosyltransferase family 4 protein [Bacteroidota bacterium]